MARTLIALFALSLALCLCSSQSILNTSYPNYVDMYKPVDYAVIGQQKSGTSTLWNVLTGNPYIKWVSFSKESFWFNGEFPRSTLCDNHVEEYQRLVAMQRQNFNRTDILIGDWSATFFSCICCPVLLKTLNPSIKLVVVLRDPVQRALSRFLEQKRAAHMPYHKEVVNYTFAEHSQQQLDALEGCLARAAPLKTPGSADGALVGWGAGMDMGRWMTLQCFARNNMYGWSAYDVFLENYLAHFPKQQMLVLYTDDLATMPLESFRRVEDHLGAPPYQYDPARSSMVFNSRDCYNWRCGKQQGEVRPITDLGEGRPQDGPFAQALTRLKTFFTPHVQRLAKWADEGLITPLPEAWRKAYS